MRIVLAFLIFLFGATFWWMSSPVNERLPVPHPWLWTLTNFIVVLAFIGYLLTTWSVLRNQAWWAIGAVVSSVFGLIAVGTFLVSERTVDFGFQDLGAQLNVWFHLIGATAVIVLAWLSTLRPWVPETQ